MIAATMYCEGEHRRFPMAEFVFRNGAFLHDVPDNPHWADTGEAVIKPILRKPVGKMPRPTAKLKNRTSTTPSRRIPKPAMAKRRAKSTKVSKKISSRASAGKRPSSRKSR